MFFGLSMFLICLIRHFYKSIRVEILTNRLEKEIQTVIEKLTPLKEFSCTVLMAQLKNKEAKVND